MSVKTLLLAVALMLPTAGKGDYSIAHFPAALQGFPQTENEFITAERKSLLREISFGEIGKLSDHAIVLRRGFGEDEYALYAGKKGRNFGQLDKFSFIRSGDLSSVLRRKIYAAETTTPDQDLRNVYFDRAGNLYVLNRRRIYYHEHDRWRCRPVAPLVRVPAIVCVQDAAISLNGERLATVRSRGIMAAGWVHLRIVPFDTLRYKKHGVRFFLGRRTGDKVYTLKQKTGGR